MITFREDVTSATPTGFHAGPLSWLNWNLEMLVFSREKKLEHLEKNPQDQNQTQI